MILLWKSTSIPVAPLLKRQGAILPTFHRSRASLKLPMMLLCKGTCVLVAPLSKGRWAVLLLCSPVPASLVERQWKLIKNRKKLFKVDLHKPWNYQWYCYEKAPPPPFLTYERAEGQHSRHASILRRPCAYPHPLSLLVVVGYNVSL